MTIRSGSSSRDETLTDLSQELNTQPLFRGKVQSQNLDREKARSMSNVQSRGWEEDQMKRDQPRGLEEKTKMRQAFKMQDL